MTNPSEIRRYAMLVDQDRFDADVLGSAEPVLVDFFATWCPPCQRLAPTIDKLARDGYRVSKVNIDDLPDLASRFQVNSVPTLMVVKGGEVVARFVGSQREQTLKDALDRARGAA
jgi:thioredoxin 1